MHRSDDARASSVRANSRMGLPPFTEATAQLEMGNKWKNNVHIASHFLKGSVNFFSPKERDMVEIISKQF